MVNSARGKPGGTEADIEKAMFGTFTERLVTFETAGGCRAHVIGPLLLLRLLQTRALSILTRPFEHYASNTSNYHVMQVQCISGYLLRYIPPDMGPRDC